MRMAKESTPMRQPRSLADLAKKRVWFWVILCRFPRGCEKLGLSAEDRAEFLSEKEAGSDDRDSQKAHRPDPESAGNKASLAE